MAAKRNSRKKQDSESFAQAVSGEALRGVAAILFFAIAMALVLAAFGLGGTVGSATFNGLTWVLGVGYMLLPLSMIMVSILIFRSLEKSFGYVQGLSMAIFLLSGLGLVNLVAPGKGGVLGSAISTPLVTALATPITVLFLLSFIIVSLIIAFDIKLTELFAKLRGFFALRTSEESEEDKKIENVPVIGMPLESQEEADVPEAKPLPKKDAPIKAFTDAPAQDGFPVILATGSAYVPPPATLLAKNKGKPEVGDVKANMNIIKRTLQNFGIQVEMDEASIGPTVTRYAMKPAEGVRLAKIVALQSNLELALAATPVRIEAPIPGKSLVGIEVPNIARTTLGMGPIVSDEQFAASDKPLLAGLGRAINGAPIFADIAKMPHLLVAGTTGAGKSVTINDIIISLLYRCGPERLRFIMVDPKRVELTLYNPIPHLLTPVITDPKKAILAMKWAAKEMERRYNILEAEKVRDIASYHENVLAPALAKVDKNSDKPLPEAMPYIVFIIDELADIMQSYPREMEAGIVRLAQMSRAVGIHLILSTQRPSVKVITGLIKANIPARIALQVASQIDSRTILDTGGAEKLLGAGDMLFLSGEMSKPRRIQAPYISEDEVKKVVDFIAKHNGSESPSEIDFGEAGKVGSGIDAVFSSMDGHAEGGDDDDDLYPEAKKTVIEAGKASTSYLQRKLGVGYARAARLMDLLEDRGVIGPADGAKPRDIIGAGNADELAQEPATAVEEPEGARY